jgi:hypothetical protein
MLVVRALKISQLTDGGMPPTYDSMHWFLYLCDILLSDGSCSRIDISRLAGELSLCGQAGRSTVGRPQVCDNNEAYTKRLTALI